jgi:TrkA domain protein
LQGSAGSTARREEGVVADVEQVKLPGVGVLHNFVTSSGERLGVVTHRTGVKDLVVYERPGSDRCKSAVRLDDDDARTLTEILGGTKVTEGLTALQSLPGITIDWMQVEDSSACAGSELGHQQLAGGEGVTIVAVIRNDRTIPSPAADFRIFPGDTLVAVGTPEAVERLWRVLQNGPETAG